MHVAAHKHVLIACMYTQYTHIMWIDPSHTVLQRTKFQLKNCLTYYVIGNKIHEINHRENKLVLVFTYL